MIDAVFSRWLSSRVIDSIRKLRRQPSMLIRAFPTGVTNGAIDPRSWSNQQVERHSRASLYAFTLRHREPRPSFNGAAATARASISHSGGKTVNGAPNDLSGRRSSCNDNTDSEFISIYPDRIRVLRLRSTLFSADREPFVILIIGMQGLEFTM